VKEAEICDCHGQNYILKFYCVWCCQRYADTADSARGHNQRPWGEDLCNDCRNDEGFMLPTL